METKIWWKAEVWSGGREYVVSVPAPTWTAAKQHIREHHFSNADKITCLKRRDLNEPIATEPKQ